MYHESESFMRVCSALILPIFVISLLFLVSCKQTDSSEEEGLQTLTFDLENARSVKYSELFAKPEFVSLETRGSQSLVGGASYNVQFTEKYILVYSEPGPMATTGSIHLFDRKGNFLRKIEYLGRGPGMTSGYIKIDVDFEKEEIHLMANMKRAMMIYSFEGEFLREQKVGIYSYNFKLVGEQQYLFYNIGEPNPQNPEERGIAYYFDATDTSLLSCLPVYEKLRYNTLAPEIVHFDRSRQTACLLPPSYDTIYRLHRNPVRMEAAWYLDYKGLNPPWMKTLDQHYEYPGRFVYTNYNTRFLQDKLILIAGTHENKRHDRFFCIHGFRDKQGLVAGELCNDYIGETAFHKVGIPEDLSVGNDHQQLVFLIQPYRLLSNIQKLSADQRRKMFSYMPELQEIVPKLKEEDNPLLMFVRPKE